MVVVLATPIYVLVSNHDRYVLPRACLAKTHLPQAPHVRGLVKLYDLEAAEKFKTTELIDTFVLDGMQTLHSTLS